MLRIIKSMVFLVILLQLPPAYSQQDDGYMLLYECHYGYPFQLFRTSSDGSFTELLTPDFEWVGLIGWTSDYEWIVFKADDQYLYRMHPDGSEQQRFLHWPGTFEYVYWIPETTSVLIETDHDGLDAIYRLDIISGEVVMLSGEGQVGRFIGWLPDTNNILLTESLPGSVNPVYYTIDIDGNHRHQILANRTIGSLRMSPDGKWIYFSEDTVLYRMRPDESDVQALVKWESPLGVRGLSPDGNWVFFASYSNTYAFSRFYAMRSDGSHLFELGELGSSGYGVSPDSSYVYFSDGFNWNPLQINLSSGERRVFDWWVTAFVPGEQTAIVATDEGIGLVDLNTHEMQLVTTDPFPIPVSRMISFGNSNEFFFAGRLDTPDNQRELFRLDLDSGELLRLTDNNCEEDLLVVIP